MAVRLLSMWGDVSQRLQSPILPLSLSLCSEHSIQDEAALWGPSDQHSPKLNAKVCKAPVNPAISFVFTLPPTVSGGHCFSHTGLQAGLRTLRGLVWGVPSAWISTCHFLTFFGLCFQYLSKVTPSTILISCPDISQCHFLLCFSLALLMFCLLINLLIARLSH